MHKTEFNKGADIWFANYFHDTYFCSRDEFTGKKFGKYFCTRSNENYLREELCKRIEEVVSNVHSGFKRLSKRVNSKACFSDEPIEYEEKLHYIKFPDFKNKDLEPFVIRMDINPCMGDTSSNTKIYCIPRYQDIITTKDALDFFEWGETVSKKIVAILAKHYINIYNDFIEEHAETKVHSARQDVLKKPFDFVSKVVGSDDPDTTEFIKLTDNQPEWKIFCKKNKKAREIFSLLSKMNKSAARNWKLADYKWFNQEVLFEKENGQGKKSYLSKSYLGFKEMENFGHLIGVANSPPRDSLLPLHVDIMRGQ